MNKFGPFALAAQFAPRLFQVRRRTWFAVGMGMLVLFVLLIWAGLALLGWLFGQAQGWMGNAPEAVRGALKQAEQAVPDAREKLNGCPHSNRRSHNAVFRAAIWDRWHAIPALRVPTGIVMANRSRSNIKVRPTTSRC